MQIQFNGTGILMEELKDFCTNESFSNLQSDIANDYIQIEEPFDTFEDDFMGGAIVVFPYTLDPLANPTEVLNKIQRLRFFTEEEAAKVIYEALQPYFDEETCQTVFSNELSDDMDVSEIEEVVRKEILKTIENKLKSTNLELVHNYD